MTEQEYIKKIHEKILEIMDIIHEICMRNHITYYLTGGSLLGAIRHKGFIPWDDDLDIAMPRNDYNRFLKICGTSLPENYAIVNMHTDPGFRSFFMKVVKKNTVFSGKSSIGEVMDMGIFVDIFPLDETNGKIKILALRKKLMWVINGIILMKTIPGYYNGVKKLLVRFFSKEFLTKMLYFIMCMTNGKGELYYTNFASQYPVWRKTQLRTVYGKGQLIPFENRMYLAPNDYKTDLLSNFGPKYMELPPIEKRKTHYPVKVVFSDGTVFEAQKSDEHKVSVEESINW